jgi:hypothetical protein
MSAGEKNAVYDTSMGKPIRPFRRPLVSWLGLFFLSFNLLAGIFMPTPTYAKLLGGGDEGHYQICTSAGLIEIDENGKSVPATATGHSVELCVFCLPLMHGGLDAPASFAVAEAQLLSSGAVFSDVSSLRLVSARLAGSSAPRAPPAI